jgi:hypothetical protein
MYLQIRQSREIFILSVDVGLQVVQHDLGDGVLLSLQVKESFVSKQLDFLVHTGSEPSIGVFEKLLLCELLRFLSFSEVDEEESELGDLEEFLLSNSAVLIHGLAHNREVDGRVCQVTVVFLMSVAEHKHLE